MTDLTKILLSVGSGWFLGLISGIFLEPFKAWYMRRFTARRAEEEFYKELCNLYEVFCLSDDRHDEYFCHVAINYNPPENFEFYFDQHREACFLIKDWRGIKSFYEIFKAVRDAAIKKGYNENGTSTHNLTSAQEIGKTFEEWFETNRLNKESLLRYSKKKYLKSTTK